MEGELVSEENLEKDSSKENKSRRVIQPAVLVSAPERVTVKTRLRPDPTDEVLLRELGEWYNKELLWVFKQVNALKHKPSMSDKKHLKRELIKRGMSARWANALIIEAVQVYNSAQAAQERYLVSLRTRIERISKRLRAREQEQNDDSTNTKPYKQYERQGKNQRLQVLQAEERKVTAQMETNRVSYVRGSKKLLNSRLHLDSTGLDFQEWRDEWRAARQQVKVPGEAGTKRGNSVLRVLSNGIVEVQLPEALKHLSNAVTRGKHARYQFNAPVNFNYRAQELRIAQDNQSAVAHSLTYNAKKQRYYLTATYQPIMNKNHSSSVKQVLRKSSGVLGVDLNKSHIAARRVNNKGNPIGQSERLEFNLEGTTTHRDAQLRFAISKLLKICKQDNLVLVIEDLDFTSSKTLGRENEKTSKTFRHTIHGFPIAKFASRLASMSTTAGVNVLAVDPAYTSKDGKQYWLPHLGRQANVHDAAALMIARRALNLKLKRKSTKHKSNTHKHKNTNNLKHKKTNHNLKNTNNLKKNINGSLGSLLKPAGNQRIENKLSSTVPSGTDTGNTQPSEPSPSSVLPGSDLNETILFEPGSGSNESDSSRSFGIVAPLSSTGEAQNE